MGDDVKALLAQVEDLLRTWVAEGPVHCPRCAKVLPKRPFFYPDFGIEDDVGPTQRLAVQYDFDDGVEIAWVNDIPYCRPCWDALHAEEEARKTHAHCTRCLEDYPKSEPHTCDPAVIADMEANPLLPHPKARLSLGSSSKRLGIGIVLEADRDFAVSLDRCKECGGPIRPT